MSISVQYVIVVLFSIISTLNLVSSSREKLTGCLRSQHLLVENETDDQSPLPCNPEEGRWRPGNTYNDPSTLITDSADACCELCRQEEECVTWSRDRFTGGCAFKDDNSSAVLDDRYDSGSIRGTNAGDVVELGECFAEPGLTYPRGTVIRRIHTDSHEECCNRCTEESECFSWYRNGNSGRCVLNSDTPSPRLRSRGNFAGASII